MRARSDSPLRLPLWGLALLALLVPLGCGGPPPVYLQQIYVDSVQPLPNGAARLVLRFLSDDGEPAAAPDPAALTPVVQGVPVGRVVSLSPVRDRGLYLALVLPSYLGEPLFEPSRVGLQRLVSALGPSDRVLLVAYTPLAEPRWLSPSEAGAALAALPPPPPTDDAAAALRRAGQGPMGWAQPPTALLEQALSSLGTAGAAAPRRSLVTVLDGRVVGRSWTPVTRWAAAAGADLHVVIVPPDGRSASPGRIEPPLFVYPAPDLAALPQVFDLLEGAVVGGHVAELEVARSGVALVDGLALRARLPRGGWEEFAPAPLSTPPATLSIDDLTELGPGRYLLEARATDSRGIPLPLEVADLRADLDEVVLPLVPEPAEASGPPVLVLMPVAPESEAEVEAQRASMERAIDASGPGVRFVLAPSGQERFAASGPFDAAAARSALAALARGPQAPLRDLESDLQEVVRLLRQQGQQEARAGVLILANARMLRQARGRGNGTYRFRSLLQLLRRTKVTPLLVAQASMWEFDGLRGPLSELAGSDLWTVSDWRELPSMAARVAQSFSRPLRASLRSERSLAELRGGLRLRFEARGRIITAGGRDLAGVTP